MSCCYFILLVLDYEVRILLSDSKWYCKVKGFNFSLSKERGRLGCIYSLKFFIVGWGNNNEVFVVMVLKNFIVF